jgi:hypothetical protein
MGMRMWTNKLDPGEGYVVPQDPPCDLNNPKIIIAWQQPG